MQHEPRRFHFGGVIGDAERQRLKLGEPRAELLSLPHIRHGTVKAELRPAERACGYIKPSPIEAAHGDLQTLALGADAVDDGDAAPVEHHHGGGLGMPPQLFLLGAEGKPGSAAFNQKTRDASRAGFPVLAMTR